MDIFISYRRDDSSGYAGRLYDQVSAHFGGEHVFMDVATIEAGSDFVDVIDKKVGTCDALIAIIGRNWLASRDEQGHPRLGNSDDFVSAEIAAALKRNIEVIPVLVGGAKMPLQKELPELLQFLARRQAVEISDAHFTRDVADLIQDMETPGGKRAPRPSLSKLAWIAIGVTCALAVALGAWIWQHSPRPRENTVAKIATPSSAPPTNPAPPAASPSTTDSANISGNWRAVVKNENATFEIYLTFDVVGDKLFGKVFYPTGDAGILNGTIRHGEISFITKHVPQFSSEEATNTVEGRVTGAEIQIVVQNPDGYAKGVAHRVPKPGIPKVLNE